GRGPEGAPCSDHPCYRSSPRRASPWFFICSAHCLGRRSLGAALHLIALAPTPPVGAPCMRGRVTSASGSRRWCSKCLFNLALQIHPIYAPFLRITSPRIQPRSTATRPPPWIVLQRNSGASLDDFVMRNGVTGR